jgi:hypothetical protein
VNDHTTTQRVLFPDLFDKPLVAQFDQHHSSSDGGAILLKAADQRLGLTERMASSLDDERDPTKVRHELRELISQRVFAIACGYPDCNDAGRLADDPIFKLIADRDPIEGEPLASQPTLSRFENAVHIRDLYRTGMGLAETVVERHRKRRRGRAQRVTIDLDVTDDATHGQQQLSLFNGHYDSWCYLPLLGFVSFDDEPEQYLVAAVLRAGNAPTTTGAAALLHRLIACVRKAFPKARIRVRLDGGFATPEMFGFLVAQQAEYVVAMAKNAVLEDEATYLMWEAQDRSANSGQTEKVYGECQYAARTWDWQARVIIKAEVTRLEGREPKDNPRFVVTNLKGDPEYIYEKVYCGRGEIENRIKELKLGMELGRTSCTRFWSNQFRVLLTAAAYILLQEMRLRLARTALARAQANRLREQLLKIGCRVVVSVRRIVLHLPTAVPSLRAWKSLACALGARAG